MGVINETRKAVSDARNFGWRFLSGRWAAKGSRDVIALPVRHYGHVFVRPANTDIETLRDVLAGRSYDFSFPAQLGDRVNSFYHSVLSAGRKPVIIDAGANIGAASLWFRRLFPEAHIVAIEPDADNGRVLRENIGGLPNCTILNAAIGSTSGFAAVRDGEGDDSGWAKQTERATSGVPIVTMAEAIATVDDGTALIVKIDIEGFESDLFQANLDWLDDVRVVIIEPHDWMKPGEGTSFSFQRAMAAHSFELFIRGENLIYVRLQPDRKNASSR
ncbi:MAG: FkbM family methyltransferase [Sphingomonas adhaesiva]|uniref:FkbM family methyltransferase n=1 Tax=Sphingomonas adhaesiva TaxID=28212 RepID=UPI002FFA0BAE